MIKNKRKNDYCFSFVPVAYEDILKKTDNLDTSKASQQSDIPTKILKQNSDYFAGYFCGNLNQCFSKSMFRNIVHSARGFGQVLLFMEG